MIKPIIPMLEATDTDVCGGKAVALSQMLALGFNVPKFLVLAPAAFHKTGMRKAVAIELQSALSTLGPGPYAARSSAREEDGAEQSHAGQYLSVLELEADKVAEASVRVWKSSSNENVANYRKSVGALDQGDAPAVVLQQMVQARCAGVMFTADPVSGRRDQIVISAISGLGEALVSGEQDGLTYILNKSDGALIEQPDGDLLSDIDIKALHELAVNVEEAAGGAQDIEWAFDEKELFLLQSRPVTTELRPEPNTDDFLSIFDNSNIVESYPGLVSPLTYSFAQYAYARVYRAFVKLLGVRDAEIQANAAVFDNMLARIDGRVYYNLVNWYRALALLPGFSINRDFMETMMGVAEPLPKEFTAEFDRPKTGKIVLIGEWLRVIRVGLRLLLEAGRLNRTVRGFYARLNVALEKPAADLDQKPLSALGVEYRRIEADLLDKWDAPLINDFLCMIAFGASRKLLGKWAGPAGLELHNDIMIGQGDIVSAEPAQRIAEMGEMVRGNEGLIRALIEGDKETLKADTELWGALQSYLGKFSDRCAEELKLESVPLDLDPTPLYAAIAASAQTNRKEPSAKPKDKNHNLAALFKGRPIRRLLVNLAVSWAKKLVKNRENLRFERTRIFGRARHLFRAAGTQLHAHGFLSNPDDIFYLTVPEVLGVIEGFAVDQKVDELAAMRRAELERARERPDPDERIIVRGAAISYLNAVDTKQPEAVEDVDAKIGVGCCAGKVTAVARLIKDPRTQSINPGEILVARHTDPGWIAVFCNASAIVVERGSLLSHSAIVARELGIPCVVGLKQAMSWLNDGERIEVDGASGQVRRVK